MDRTSTPHALRSIQRRDFLKLATASTVAASVKGRLCSAMTAGQNEKAVILGGIAAKYHGFTLGALLAPVIGRTEASLVDELKTDPAGVARSLRAAEGQKKGLVLFVDQLEELVTVSDPDEERSALNWRLAERLRST